MNAGLSNLDTLRKFILPNSTGKDPQFDPKITLIGLGVARLFDTWCNRKFTYGENLTQIFSGDRDHWYMPNFPVSAFARVELRYFKADDWVDVSGQPLSANEETGLLHFGYTLGRTPIQVRVTWSGGYWFETLEPDDAAYPSAPPASIANCTAIEPAKFLLPEDIRLAWLTQCGEVWNKIDKLGTALVEKPDSVNLSGSLKLAPMVEEILRPHRRLQIS